MKTILLTKPEGWTYQAMVPEDFRYRKVLLQDTGIDRTEHEVAVISDRQTVERKLRYFRIRKVFYVGDCGIGCRPLFVFN